MRARARGAFHLSVLCAALAATGCFGGGAPSAAPAPAPLPSEAEIAAFSTRIEKFYKTLEGIPLDALVTYENPDLRACFGSTPAFSDYFSALATAARQARFRDSVARTVRIREFRFDGPESAIVDIEFRSVHQRVLRFWSIGFERQDEWALKDGVWQIVPAKL
jgi:hypothetical protein